MPLSNESKRELETLLRKRHEFENEQMHKRLSWLGSFQSFLFAGVCLAWGRDKVEPLILIIAALGLVIALQGIVALSGVGRSLVKIQKKWVQEGLDKRSALGVFGLYEGDEVSAIRVFPWPEVFIPFALSVAWGFVLYLKLCR